MTGKLKWLMIVVAALVVINIALVAFIWLRNGEDRRPLPPDDARNYLIKSLAMDGAQVKEFDSLRQGHFLRIRSYKEEMRDLKTRLFEQLSWPRNAATDSQVQKIGVLQSKIDLETFEHFAALRSFLNNQQAKQFDATIQEVLRSMAPEPEGGKGPPPHRPGHFLPGPPEDGPPPETH